MEKNKKIFLIVSVAVVLIITGFVFLSFAKKNNAPDGKDKAAAIQETNQEKELSADELAKEEANYKVENKEEAKKALGELDSLMDSAGDSSM